MDKFLKMLARLFPGKTFTEDAVESELHAAMKAEAQKAVDAAVAPLNERIKALEPLEQKVKDLTPLAADGKAYRDDLVNRYVAGKVKLEEIGAKPEEQAPIKKMAEAFEIGFLKSEVAHIEKRVEEKFPNESQLKDPADPEGKKKPLEKKKSLRPDK